MADLKLNENGETGCCKKFDPAPWQDKEVVWKEKLFVKDHASSFLHIPLNMGKKIMKNMSLIEKAQAQSPYQLMLSDDRSPWGSDLYIDVAKDVPGAQMAKISGKFLTKVFDGSFNEAGRWAKEMARYVEEKGKKYSKLYFSYTTCPKCAKAYGHNYTVIIAQIA